MLKIFCPSALLVSVGNVPLEYFPQLEKNKVGHQVIFTI